MIRLNFARLAFVAALWALLDLVRWLRFKVKYKLGLAREAVDFIVPEYEECPEWDDESYV